MFSMYFTHWSLNLWYSTKELKFRTKVQWCLFAIRNDFFFCKYWPVIILSITESVQRRVRLLKYIIFSVSQVWLNIHYTTTIQDIQWNLSLWYPLFDSIWIIRFKSIYQFLAISSLNLIFWGKLRCLQNPLNQQISFNLLLSIIVMLICQLEMLCELMWMFRGGK